MIILYFRMLHVFIIIQIYIEKICVDLYNTAR